MTKEKEESNDLFNLKVIYSSSFGKRLVCKWDWRCWHCWISP